MTKEELLRLLANDADVKQALSGLIGDTVVSSLEELLPVAIEGAVDGLTEGFKEHIDNSIIEGIEAAVNATEDDSEDDDSEALVDDGSPLSARLRELERTLQAERDEREKAQALADEAAFNDKVNSKYQEAFSAVTGDKVVHRDFIYKVLRGQLGELKEEDGEVYTPDGKTINEVVSSFFGSDVGKHFINASPYGLASAYGGDYTSQQSARTGITAPSESTAQSLANAFLGI